MRIKKSGFAFLLVLAMVFGAGVSAALFIINGSGVGETGAVTLTSEQYSDYMYYKENYGGIDELKQFILANYYKDVNPEDLMLGMKKGLFDGIGDVYSSYFTAEEYNELTTSLEGEEYSGVGMLLTMGNDGYVRVLTVYNNSPAEEAGVAAGGKIYAIDGESCYGMDLDTVADSVRGEAGSQVTVTMVYSTFSKDYTMTRRKFTAPSVSYEMKENGVGYINISTFQDKTADDVEAAVKDLESRGATAFVLDMRDNGGGIVDEAVAVADFFMDSGTVVYAEDRNKDRTYYKTNDGKLTDAPFVVLINGNSASATEILAAGFQDNGAAPIVGTVSFGKGIIQQLAGLADGSAVRLTMWQYFSPKGNVIHEVGITPDYVVELTEEDYDEDGILAHDAQLEKALEVLESIR